MEELWLDNECLEAINLLKGLKDYLKNTKSNEHHVLAIIQTNLGVCYYKAGFLEESHEEFSAACSTLKELASRIAPAHKSKLPQKLRYDMLLTRLELQICILFS